MKKLSNYTDQLKKSLDFIQNDESMFRCFKRNGYLV